MIKTLTTTNEVWVRHQQLLSQIIRPATFSLFEKVTVVKGSNALCLQCGEGEVVFHLADLVGINGIVTGLDPSEENVHTAQQLADIKKIGNVLFCQNNRFQQEEDRSFGLIHGYLQPTHSFDLHALTGQTRDFLQEGGIAMFEVIDFSTFFSTPKNFAFERFLELYTSVVHSYWGEIAFRTRLNQSLVQAGFQNIQHQYVAPTFLRGKSRHLPSLTLGSIQEEVLRQKLATRDEIQVLLYELSSFEQKEHPLISLPGIHQMWGYKV